MARTTRRQKMLAELAAYDALAVSWVPARPSWAPGLRVLIPYYRGADLWTGPLDASPAVYRAALLAEYPLMSGEEADASAKVFATIQAQRKATGQTSIAPAALEAMVCEAVPASGWQELERVPPAPSTAQTPAQSSATAQRKETPSEYVARVLREPGTPPIEGPTRLYDERGADYEPHVGRFDRADY
jgi:hypothetical protein